SSPGFGTFVPTFPVQEHFREAAGNLGDFESVCQPVVEDSDLTRADDLRDLGKASKSGRVEDPVPVALEGSPLVLLPLPAEPGFAFRSRGHGGRSRRRSWERYRDFT